MAFDLDKYLQHQLYLERLATGNVNSVLLPSLVDTQKAIALILNEQGIITNSRELNQITKAITEQINSEKGWATITTNMEEMAIYEASYQASLSSAAFAKTMNIPKDSKIVSYVTKAIMSLTSGSRTDAGVWSRFIQANKDGQAKFVNSIVADGYSKGQTSHQLNRRIKEAYTGVLAREAETLARTGFISYAAEASNAMIEDNTDVLEEYYYVTVFDNRTSDICIGVSKFNQPSKRYKVGDPKAPNPPLHYNCRTRRLGVTKGWVPLGDKASVGGKKGSTAEESFDRRKDKNNGNTVKYRGRKDKAFKAEPIKATTSRDKWLRSQPDWFIYDSLGKGKGDLFIGGKPLSSFSDATGRPLTLAQIKERDS